MHLTNILETITGAIGKVVFFNVLQPFGLQSDLPFALALLIFGYIVLMFKLRFIQFRKFKYIIKYTFGKKKNAKAGEISPLKTLLTSVASSTGMNATAGMVFMVGVGGAGTVFWLPIIAFLCLPFRFAEVYLSHSYRSSTTGETLGGPFDYIKKGLADMKLPKVGIILAFLYAFIMILCGSTGVAMYEANQFVSVITDSFSFLADKKMFMSGIIVLLVFLLILGGTKQVFNFMGTALPIVAITYLAVAFIVIIANIDKLGEAFVLIFKDAMHPKALAGGFLASLCMTVRKASLSHETGLGTSGIVHASSSETDSIKEATTSMMAPLINTFCVCMVSALVLVLTGFYNPETAKDGAVALFKAFGSVNKLLPYVVTLLVPFLTFNVFLGWCNYVIKCTKYCFKSKKVLIAVMALFLTSTFIGGITNDFVLIMNLVDALVMSIIFINVPVIILLGGKVFKALKQYTFK